MAKCNQLTSLPFKGLNSSFGACDRWCRRLKAFDVPTAASQRVIGVTQGVYRSAGVSTRPSSTLSPSRPPVTIRAISRRSLHVSNESLRDRAA